MHKCHIHTLLGAVHLKFFFAVVVVAIVPQYIVEPIWKFLQRKKKSNWLLYFSTYCTAYCFHGANHLDIIHTPHAYTNNEYFVIYIENRHNKTTTTTTIYWMLYWCMWDTPYAQSAIQNHFCFSVWFAEMDVDFSFLYSTYIGIGIEILAVRLL